MENKKNDNILEFAVCRKLLNYDLDGEKALNAINTWD